MKFIATVVGGTGLVGNFLIQELLADENCKQVNFITRRKIKLSHPKINECIIDFSREEDYKKHITGDVLFSCLGTTRAQAGSKEKQYLVDYTYQYTAAKAASENNIKNYVLVSSPWSSIDSSNYYCKMKAKLEIDVEALSFDKIAIIKPNGLIGERNTTRIGERYGLKIFSFLTRIIPPLRKHQPIQAIKVAKVMLLSFYKSLSSQSKVLMIERTELDELFKEKKTTHSNLYKK
ncbi:NAD(P)H-binding protein [Tamlana sp. 2201CG12-4]|uniref:NAD(P)H-binding protein n=1 Tax=Tamlana sp. 2201CG12-4 TaxID=3112582 RepID=UPI002DB987B6|nr:NAD(P)H-binding protein [Tamlana sp. 2201CG12-4]MEC3908898.1 NAD(P)H-binding protein [Tamlana sp. 2201CG12-4]